MNTRAEPLHSADVYFAVMEWAERQERYLAEQGVLQWCIRVAAKPRLTPSPEPTPLAAKPAEPGLDILRVAGSRSGKTGELVRQVVEAVQRAMPPEVIVRGDLDAAWAEAEAALPEGWRLHVTRSDEDYAIWQASAVSPAFFDGENDNDAECAIGEGEGPAAAVHALAARLRERSAAE